MGSRVTGIGEFDETRDQWMEYIERLEHYFVANDIVDENKRKSVLLSSCGNRAYSLFRNLLAPTKPGETGYDVLKETMKNHQNPKPSVIVERFKFNRRDRKNGESVPCYVAELRKLAEHCEYNDVLNDMLRDRLVCGIQDVRIQQKLLSEAQLTLDEAFKISCAMERAQIDVSDIQNDKESLNRFNSTDGNSKKMFSSKGGSERKLYCFRCGRKNHNEKQCFFKDAECFKCKTVGHISKQCPRRKHILRETKLLEENTPEGVIEHKPDEIYTIYSNTIQNDNRVKSRAIILNPKLNGISTPMELDTGASLSVISKKVFDSIKMGNNKLHLEETNVVFKTYSGQCIRALGKVKLPVQYRDQIKNLDLHVIKDDKPSLLGRDWLYNIRLNWHDIFSISEADKTELDGLLKEFDELFGTDLGLLKGEKAKIYLEENAKPIFCKSRPVPYALKQKIEDEIDRMVEAGVLEHVEVSEWATPVVPVKKPDNTVRLCGDYKITVNKASKLDNYPVPKVDDVSAAMSGCIKFSKLDLSHAYQQMELQEESKSLLTLNTHKGLYRPTRLTFGVKSATGIFQRAIENRLKGIPNTIVRVDDIFVGGRNIAEKLKNLREVLRVVRDAGLRLKREKCEFMKDAVVYLGMRIDKNGISPVEDKIAAVKDAPPPQSVSELRAFLGMLNYYHKHLENVATKLEPLHNLLRSGVKWSWGREQEEAFKSAKAMLTSEKLLVHYDPAKPLLLACDASPYGVGAVLSHVFEDGTERPIAYASRTLNTAERNYSQLEKEGLSIIFGVRKFHQYCYGRSFTILSDNKPLEGLLGEEKPISSTSVARIQRWAVFLSGYDYKLSYRPGPKHENADALSRIPIKNESEENIDPDCIRFENVRLLELDSVPITAEDVRNSTKRDKILSKVMQCLVADCWVGTEKFQAITPYFLRRDELSVDEGCVIWGSRVVAPPDLRNRILDQLHECHPGVNRMKSLARSYLWWPGMDGEVEKLVKSCHICQLHQKNTAKAPIHPWEWTNKPWVRIHLDYAGPYLNKMFLVVIDSHSKWLEVMPVSEADTKQTIEKLRMIFATHGLPEQCVTDNGSPFTSIDFENYLQRSGIKQIRTSPYHPASNGMAERMVQVFKTTMKKMSTCKDLSERLQRFLFNYRITPHTTTGKSPAELLMGRKLVSALDLIKPNVGRRVREQQTIMSRNGDARSKVLDIGSDVYIRNFGQGSQWISGKLVNRHGPLTWLVQLADGRTIQRHADHIRVRYDLDPGVAIKPPVENRSSMLERNQTTEPNDRDTSPEMSTERPETVTLEESTPADNAVSNANESVINPEEGNEYTAEHPRRSGRERRKPDYYGH